MVKVIEAMRRSDSGITSGTNQLGWDAGKEEEDPRKRRVAGVVCQPNPSNENSTAGERQPEEP